MYLLIGTEACAYRKGVTDDEHLCRTPIISTMSNENNEYDQFLSQRTCNLVGERMSIQQIFTVDLLQSKHCDNPFRYNSDEGTHMDIIA